MPPFLGTATTKPADVVQNPALSATDLAAAQAGSINHANVGQTSFAGAPSTSNPYSSRSGDLLG